MREMIEALGEMWARLSEREQRLGYGVAATFVVVILFTGFNSAVGYLKGLDDRIAATEDELVRYREQLARKQSVEQRYAEVASQHSSAWSEAEIHDRLRQEIYRLAQKVPPPLDERGVPIKTTTGMGNLVEIPSLQQGRLEDSGEGYREYKLRFSIPSADLSSLFDFIERLQRSPQSLRVDGFEMSRGSGSSTVTGITFNITRTIVSGNAEAEGEAAAPAETAPVEQADAATELLQPDKWTGEGLRISRRGVALHAALQEGEAGEFFTVRSLPGGVIYEMLLDVSAKGNVELAVAEEGGRDFSGASPVENDGTSYRYTVRFMTPGEAGSRMRVRVPVLRLIGADSEVSISGLRLRMLE